jgi:DNA-binding transcriptional LysR family regulator
MAAQSDWENQVGRRLKLRHLRVFSAVVECGSMAKAAAQLRISQPTVSQVIAELEHTFGVRLLDRSPQGVEPTVYGDALLKRSIVALDELKQSSRDIEFLADPTAGDVRVGSHEIMNAGLLPAVIGRLSRQHPRLVFTVTQAPTTAAQYHDLRERRVDFIFGRLAGPIADEDLKAEILFEDPLIVVASTGNKWLQRRNIDPAELIDEPWCLPRPESGIAPFVTQAFRAVGLGLPRHTVSANSAHLFYAMVHTGRFLSVAPASTLRFSGKRLGLKAVSVHIPIQPGPIGIVTLKNRTISPVAQLFIECARELAKPLAKRK